NGAGSRSTDEVRPEPASGSARLPRENPTTRPPGQAGITYKERLQPRSEPGLHDGRLPRSRLPPCSFPRVRGKAGMGARAAGAREVARRPAYPHPDPPPHAGGGANPPLFTNEPPPQTEKNPKKPRATPS